MDGKLVAIAGLIVGIVLLSVSVTLYRDSVKLMGVQKAINDRATRLELPFDMSLFDGTVVTAGTVESLSRETTLPFRFNPIIDGSKTYDMTLVRNGNGVIVEVMAVGRGDTPVIPGGP